MSQDSQPMRFYVLRVLSGQEKKVCEYIEAAKSNGTLGSYVRRVLVPTEQVVSQRNGKKVVKERPYMPGYVLVEAALVGDTEHTLCTIPNVIGFFDLSYERWSASSRAPTHARSAGSLRTGRPRCRGCWAL